MNILSSLYLTYATRVVLSKTTLYFDLWQGKHSIEHAPCCSFWNWSLLLLFLLLLFCFFITFVWFLLFWFTVKVPGGSRWLRKDSVGFRVRSGWFRVVPGGSGRFRVGSAFYIHPGVLFPERRVVSENLRSLPCLVPECYYVFREYVSKDQTQQKRGILSWSKRIWSEIFKRP